ncbi:hypothetical protein [Serratia marcescens]|uniref:hypothetical protein n=1 Tax=Serratia marcescens TaxID=615 RepID=UPI003879BB33
MNTAFAKAYSVDANGTSAGFNVNGFFIEQMFFERFASIPDITFTFTETSIQLKYKDNIALELYVNINKYFTYKGLNTHVYGISTVGSSHIDGLTSTNCFPVINSSKRLKLKIL